MLSINLIKNELENRLVYLQPLLKLANTHMVDYFSQNAFKCNLPIDLQNEIQIKSPEVVIESIFNDSFIDLPSIYSFIKESRCRTLKNCKNICLSVPEFQSILKSRFNCSEMSGVKLEVFMSSKKSHEVEILSSLAAVLHKITGTTNLVDIGDGRGYLSSILAMHHQIPILGIDSSPINTDSAVKRVQKLSKVWNGLVYKKKSKETTAGLYKQVTQFVDENFDLSDLVQTIFLNKSNKIGLVGLHTCGNLSATCLNLFKSNPDVLSICNVGCCYHLLDERFENDPKSLKSFAGFPLSQFLINKKTILGRAARMIAAQSIDRILNKKELPSISIFYRAVFEMLVKEFNPELQDRQVGRSKKISTDFVNYTQQAYRKLGADCKLNETEIMDFYKQYESRKSELNAFYLVRNILAPVIESVILLDRILFLLENGIENVFLVELFDPVVSPRCYGIISFK